MTVLGAIYVDSRKVFIDQSLDPAENPESEGRFNFTISHEIGHWRLHRHYLANAAAQSPMFADNKPQPTVVCRTSQAKEQIEWQADNFSSCFLMPRQFVLGAWADRFGSLKPIVHSEIAEQPFEPHVYTLETLAREFAPMFRVSIQAMRIRLENLGLLLFDHPAQEDLFANV